jgi:hypothetical protein
LRTARTDWYGATSLAILKFTGELFGEGRWPPRSQLIWSRTTPTEIKDHWHKALESIFAVCALLIDAKKKLDPRDWEFLKDELPFSDSVLKKLLVIGKDSRLQKRVVYDLLPPNYSIVYEVTQLTDDEQETAVKQGEISPRMRRTTFIAWRNDHRGGENDDNVPKKIPSWVSASVFAGLQLDPEGFLPIKKALKLKDELTSIWKRYGIYGLQINYGGPRTRSAAKSAE